MLEKRGFSFRSLESLLFRSSEWTILESLKMLVLKNFYFRAEITIIVTRTWGDGGVVLESWSFAKILSKLSRRILSGIFLELCNVLFGRFNEGVDHTANHTLIALLFRTGSKSVLLSGEGLLLICLQIVITRSW